METPNNKILIYEKLSSILVMALGFLMPLFFLATTTEFFEFNKMALLTLVTLLLILLLGAKVFAGSSIQFVKSNLDLPIFIYTILFFIATLFSVDKTSSIWGGQGRWFPSLFGLIVITVFYYISAPNFKDAKSIKAAIYALVAGGTISSLVAIMSYFRIYLSDAPYFKNPGFTLTGSITTAVILAAISSILAMYFTYKEMVLSKKVLLITAALTNFTFIALLGGFIGWSLFILGLILAVFAVGPKEIGSKRFTTMFIFTVLVAITLLNIFPATKSLIISKDYPSETILPAKESWVVAASTIQDYPMLATGPSTFHLNFAKYRPLEMNMSNLWSVRFDKPYNEIFNTIGTLGILGLAALLLLGVKIYKYALLNFQGTDNSGVIKALAIGIFMISTAYLFTYATVLNTFVLFFFLTLLGAAHVNLYEGRKNNELVTFSFTSFSTATTTIGETSAIKHEYANIIAIAPFVLAALFGTYLYARTYVGEFYMRRAIVAAINNQATQAYDLQGKAINTNPQRDAYHTSYAQTNLVLANALASNKNLTDQDKQTIQTLVSQAIRSTRLATEVVNPLNVSNWETRALIYRSLVNVADNASDWAINAYNTAIQLDPTNPALRLDLGGVYYAKSDFLAAANLFRQAATLKSDYANAHYNFAQALLNLKDIDNAKKELEITMTLVPQGSADYLAVEQQVKELASQQEAAGTATTDKKPTVEEITGTVPVATPQEPLSDPAQDTNQGLNPQALPNGN